MAPICSEGDCQNNPTPLWADSIDQIAAQFGVDPKQLCAYNNMTNCSALNFRCSAVAIPVVPM
jgi:hypothetical protein